MLEVLLREGQEGQLGRKDVHIKKGDKVLSMCFMNVGDLFWFINKSTTYSTKEVFDIPATEKTIYKLFDDLYKSISTANLFDNKRDENLERKLVERNLFNKNTKTIEWHSDATYFDSDDIVKIIKEENNYHLEFTRPEKYEDPYHWGSGKIISIRFRNSGSYYDPFNVAFMNMFNKAQNLKETDYGENRRWRKTITRSVIFRAKKLALF